MFIYVPTVWLKGKICLFIYLDLTLKYNLDPMHGLGNDQLVILALHYHLLCSLCCCSNVN